MCCFTGRSLRKYLTHAEWMFLTEETRLPCLSLCPAVPSTVQALALAPVMHQAPAPVPVKVRTHVRPVIITPIYVKPVLPARDRGTSQVIVQAQGLVTARAKALDHAQALNKEPLFPHYQMVCSLKGHLWHRSQMLLTPLPQAFLLFLTSWVPCLYILQECCWCATAARLINS